ncbi:cell division protein ZipA C-terminal FtsZ-binding domain-containing protein [Methylophilus sp. Leaf408]|uniref:cell division protein ZipA C-terminal FtsZ-binding domain-containing protein n=1 Tax=Methylophilus sp. Leaf408 TaxID=2876561 RepID=UPI001E60B484|nr:cell division protein ZipA C-terminal FtsZ-binding domain-containing protein [Methylophilus sp. Leaf408]
MSDLWMILVLLGVSIVLAVVVFNWWQEKKYRKDVEYRFSHTRADVLDGSQVKEPARKTQGAENAEEVEGWMSEPRVRPSVKFEPEFNVGDNAKAKTASAPPLKNPDANKQGNEVRPVPPVANPSVSKTEPAFTEPAYKAEPSAHQPQYQATDHFSEPKSPAMEQLTTDYSPESYDSRSDNDYQTESAAGSVSAVVIPAALHTAMDWVGVIDAPLGVMLIELEDLQAEARTFPHHATLWGQQASSAVWLDVLAMDAAAMQNQVPLSQVVCSLQLADRGGPVDQDTLKRFQKSMETLARALGLTIHWQGGYEPSQQAQLIDAFCIEVDKAVEFHVLANQGMFHATKLRGLAEASGMQLSPEGRFELFNSDGDLEYSIRNYEGKPFSGEMLKTAVMTGVTFQLDIPTTANSLQVFDRMVDLARNMAGSLSASLIDVNRKPIGDVQLDKIRQQLNNISNAMAAQGITPGSAHAKRLFS